MYPVCAYGPRAINGAPYKRMSKASLDCPRPFKGWGSLHEKEQRHLTFHPFLKFHLTFYLFKFVSSLVFLMSISWALFGRAFVS